MGDCQRTCCVQISYIICNPIQHLAPPFLPTTMRRISSFSTSPARLAPGSVRHYGVQPMSVKTMGLLPRGQGFLFQKEEGATSCVQQLNRIYILDKELRDLLRTEANEAAGGGAEHSSF